jgi:hypothetical protein
VRRAIARAARPAASAIAIAAIPAMAGITASSRPGDPESTPVVSPSPQRMRKVTLTRLVSRKNATVRRAMCPVSMPPRRRIQAPSASPPAPPTERSEFAASSESPISLLVRQLILRQKTARNAST